MTEFCIGDRVCFRQGAEVSPMTLACEATVEGSDEAGDVDYVIVRVDGLGVEREYEQWVLPREIRLVSAHGKRRRQRIGEPDEDGNGDFAVAQFPLEKEPSP
jgi:hypothetical protein